MDRRPESPGFDSSDNRLIRVFVSSTFRDMLEERDKLMTHTWPELRRFCKERQVELVEVDLRWGISESQSERNETLKLCLGEIRACRPFFIGLLGERYGGAPADAAFTADLKEEHPWLIKNYGKSFTEFEILYGVLNNPEMAGRAFFYFRDPAYAKAHGVDFLAENTNASLRQSELKDAIRAVCKTKNIPLYENYSDPSELAALVLNQLKMAIADLFPTEAIPDPLAHEALNHKAFAEIRCRTYIGCHEYFDKLNNYIKGNDTPIVLLGDSGSGKSALLANWIQEWSKSHPNDIIFQHYIGSTPDSIGHWKLMTRLMAEINKISGVSDEIPHSHDEILLAFPAWLAKARSKAEREGFHFIVVLDALNQLEDVDNAKNLGWLPSHSFKGPLKLIVSTLSGDTLRALDLRHWDTQTIKPLSPDDRRKMIGDYLLRFGKKIDSARLIRIADNPATANPLYLKIFLDELRVTGTHDRLDERINDYLAATDIPLLMQKVLTRYQSDYERDCPGLVKEVLGLIWASRRGLTEAEILRILRPADLPQLPLAFWSPLRAALEESLIDRGGYLNYIHDFIRIAVEVAFVPDEDSKNSFRQRLASHFEAQPENERNCDELPWLLKQMNARTRLRSCLLEINRFIFMFARDEDEITSNWVWLGEVQEMGKSYQDAFKKWSLRSGGDKDSNFRAAARISHILFKAGLVNEAEPLMREALKMCPKGDPTELTDLLNDFARLLSSTNRVDEAQKYMRQALQIDESFFGKQHQKVGRDLNSLSIMLAMAQRPDEAISYMQQALQIAETNLGMNHPDVGTAAKNLGVLLQNNGRLDEAEPLLRRALFISESSLGKEDSSVAQKALSLGFLLLYTQRWEEAESLFRRALSILEKSFGPEHPDVATALNNLAQLLNSSNRSSEAEPLLKRALYIAETTFGNSHPNVSLYLYNLALTYQLLNRIDEAIPMFQKALQISESNLGPYHPEVVKDRNSLMELIEAAAQVKENESFLRNELHFAEEQFGKDHVQVAEKLNELAQFLQATNHLSEAENLMRRVISIFINSTPKNPANLVISLNNLAGLFQAGKRLHESQQQFHEALKVAEENLDKNHLATAITLNNLAMLLKTDGRPKEAQPFMCRVIEIFEKNAKINGQLHPNFQAIVKNYIEILESIQWNQYQISSHLNKIAPDYRWDDKFWN